ncbi:MAG: enoyl-CoA hydratase [Syntrophobacterales bacterium]|nr:enoyl-CoA hydratase [Syntrophobacterales bacterium]
MGNLILWDQYEAIGIITLNRPEKRNALSLELMESMIEILKDISSNEAIKVVIIKAKGPVFSAGHDLGDMVGKETDINYLRRIFRVCSDMMWMIHQLPQPVIAQVQGIATAAGCQLVATCDLAVAEAEAKFATPGVKIGLFCTTPMVPLVRVIGRRRTMEMLLTGRFISAQEALSWGLVNRVVEKERLEEETLSLAREIAQYSRFTLGLGKKAFYDQIDLDEYSAYRYAQEVMAMNSMARDAKEGICAFLEKRSPSWCNR